MARGYTMGMSSQDTISYLYCDDLPFCNYWELEYYLKPLSGAQRLLRPVSNYLNGNHDIELPVLSLSLVSQLQITKHLVDFIAVAGVCMDFFRKQLHEAAILRQLAGEQLRPVQWRNQAIEIKPIFHGIVVPVQQGTLTKIGRAHV